METRDLEALIEQALDLGALTRAEYAMLIDGLSRLQRNIPLTKEQERKILDVLQQSNR